MKILIEIYVLTVSLVSVGYQKVSFTQRTINEWNRLSADCVNASNVNMFKNKIDKYLRRAGYTQIKNSWSLIKTNNGFLVYLPPGHIAMYGNLVTSC